MKFFETMVAEYGEALANKQLALEMEGKVAAEMVAKDRMVESAAEGTFGDSQVGKKMTSRLIEPVAKHLETWVHDAETAGRGNRHSALKLFKMLPELDEKTGVTRYEMLAAVGLRYGINYAMMKDDISVMAAFRAIGAAIGNEVYYSAYVASLSKGRKKAIVGGLEKRHEDMYRRAYLSACARHDGFEFEEWNDTQMLRCGEVIVDAIRACNILELATIIPTGGKVQEAKTRLIPTEGAAEAISYCMDYSILTAQRHYPTVIPPRKWEDPRSGGYWTELTDMDRAAGLNDSLFRIAGHVHRDVREHYYDGILEEADLSAVLDSMNHIQATPWAINTDVLAVARKVFTENFTGVAGLPPVTPLAKLPRLEDGTFTEEEMRAYRKRKTELAKAEIRRSSRALRTESILSTAEKFKGEKAIYMPHSMDTRGRIYPIPAFNPQGDDLTKALLCFAEAEPIGTLENACLFKMHGANTFGHDKWSIMQRVQWVDEYAADLLEVAKDPMATVDFWGKADSPFCFLAFCFEFAGFVENGLDHCPRIVIAFDGSCSGIQHYSAMLRDSIGGAAVNLIPAMARQDIYQLVADAVNKQLEIDAISGSPDEVKLIEEDGKEAREYLAMGSRNMAQEWLNFGVTRNVTKRSVMTLAYGSKEYGFKDQILEDTIQPAIEKSGGEGMSPWVSANQAARYMAKLIWNAVQAVVVKAVEAMTWLQKIAGLVSKTNAPVSWWTPDGLPVCQFYYKSQAKRVKFLIGGTTKLYTQNTGTLEVDRNKQGSGIAPNFIHSLDATHVRMTVNHCADRGVKNFGMIHDSFGTAASHAMVMFKGVRATMVTMYAENDPLNELRERLIASLPEDLAEQVPELPARGSLNLEGILETEFAFG